MTEPVVIKLTIESMDAAVDRHLELVRSAVEVVGDDLASSLVMLANMQAVDAISSDLLAMASTAVVGAMWGSLSAAQFAILQRIDRAPSAADLAQLGVRVRAMAHALVESQP